MICIRLRLLKAHILVQALARLQQRWRRAELSLAATAAIQLMTLSFELGIKQLRFDDDLGIELCNIMHCANFSQSTRAR